MKLIGSYILMKHESISIGIRMYSRVFLIKVDPWVKINLSTNVGSWLILYVKPIFTNFVLWL